jgi:D-3-phosphoglycerate dehydrogenase / 2-oxoglutarate reductase
MRILLTTTSFTDTPGEHQEKLKSLNYKIDILRGPLKEEILLPIISNYDGIICGDDEITRKVIANGKEGKLKVISKYGIGLDKIDLKSAYEFGIKVCKTPGVNHITVSEHILALLFSYYKNIHLEYNITKKGKWERLIGHEIYGKKIGIVGYGRIGHELAQRSIALGLIVKAYDPYFNNKSRIYSKVDFIKNINELVKDIDILALTLPLNDETEGIIDEKIINSASKKMVIINTSRALIVNQKDLIKLLKANKIKAYLTDVLEEEPMIQNHPLNEFNNVIITPHIGSRTHESVQRQGLMAVENLIKNI